ncbi:MAG TPA: DUF4337 domain-containing protein [Pyrinomonadaceae bacterium]|jgi:hypothetical protein|nr:DUF4337 domain-containing protein [Pyrinomonadaceae bacterium]
MENSADINRDGDAKNRLNNAVAVMVAIVAAFMAVTKVKDDNIVQAMLQAKSDAVDTWSEYQSKRIKQHLEEMGRDQTQLLRPAIPAEGTTRLDEQLKRYESEIARYQKDEDDLQSKARGLEAQYDALNYRDDQFDLSDAALSVALAMLAVTALTGKRWLFLASLLFAVFGIVMGVAGLVGLHLHPDWLSKLLS